MKIVATATFILFFSFLFHLQIFSQSQSNNSLLWRISGNGLSKPSYLFGTMHVYDKRAFNFKDSLYIFLEQAEGFALEFNPDSANQIMEAYMNGSIKANDEVSKNTKMPPRIDTARIKPKQKKNIEKKSKNSEEEKKDMVDEFVARLVVSNKKQENSMNNFMDAYLYEMASQGQKKMYGLEEIDAQIAALHALQKGVKLKKAEELISHSADDESPIEKLYYKEDLDSIDIFYRNYFTDEGLDGFLYNRNKGMAAKIDSLVRLQTMFTAIGAAHLPGSKGVIALLKQKGYNVEPVFSSKKIFASDYKLKMSGKPGYVVREEQMGLEYEIPGKPNSQNGEAGKLVSYYYDLGGGLLYMTICGKLTSKESGQTPEEIVSQLTNQLAAKAQAKIISSKVITSQGLKGLETLCLVKDNAYMRLYEVVSKNMFYLFSLSGEKKDNLYSENAEKYLASFKLIPIPASQWMPYEFPDDGFKISIPGKPTIKPLKIKDESNTSTNSYTYFDANTGINYTVTASKTKAYNDFVNDESFFKSYSDYFTSNTLKGESSVTDTTVNGFPGKKLMKPSAKNSWKGFVIKRGNTSYFALAEYEPGIADKDVEQFLESFSLTNFSKADWQMETSPAKDFSSWTPSGIFEKHHDTTDFYLHSEEKKYYAYDRYSGLTYFMTVEPVNEYYWAPNEDSIYNYWEKNIGWNDSVITRTNIKNGQRPGRELIYVDKGDHSTTRKRLLLNGQFMYSFHVTVPPAFADETNLNLFFEKLKLAEEKTPDEILNNSPSKLFKDLQSNDSSTFQKAYEALDKVSFSQHEFMLLLQKSLLEYPKYGNNYISVNKKLLMLANKLYNTAEAPVKQQALHFIEENYSHPGKAIEEIRFPLLEIIASDKTGENFELIKKLLAEKLPSKGYDYTLFGDISDSLELVKIFYPDILQYISDTTMGMAIASLTKEMIDSNILSANILSSKKADILKLARRQLKLALKTKKASDDTYYDFRITDLLDLVGMMKQQEPDELLNEFLKAKPVDIKKEAAIALIKNNKPVSALILKQVAEDKYERVNLYEDLDKINKANLFPADFRSQQKMAESYIYQSLRDNDDDVDYTDAEFIYIKNIEYRYKGEKKRFYFYRINFPQTEEDSTSDDEIKEPNSYLAVAGPFELDAVKIDIDAKKNIAGIYYDKKFDGSLLDEYFKDFIDQRSKWDK